MSNFIHTEGTFETAIVEHLTSHGWHLGVSSCFDKVLALDKQAVLEFVKTSQPGKWKKYTGFYKDGADEKFIYRLTKELDNKGMLDVLRKGIDDYGVHFDMAYFKPESSLNPDTAKQYEQNILAVTRQVRYSEKNGNSMDLLLSLNGLPVATIELKNQLTGQSVKEAGVQYKTSRNPKEPLFQFKKRALVHFTLDSDEVYFTTKLDGEHTKFFPFNKGYNNGAGNPDAPGYGNYKTSYFWEEILSKDSWLEIIGRFLHIQKKEYEGKDNLKLITEEVLFPRYPQLDAVRKLTRDAKANGTGKNYLIQHSAGSGKSNTIAWLAYRLSGLYNAADKKVFDSVIVVTDRNVLDQQLQNTIYQFEHKQGVVKRITEDSKQLAEAIAGSSNIIITTLQKFPFALNHLSELPDRNYAVIIDEAHSSQGGEASRRMTEALAGKDMTLEESERIESEIENSEMDDDDYIRETIRKRGPQKNISIFAFTATPKARTLEVFGTKDAEGKPKPFHLYSMKQAIEEGFILDVLKNYTTYKEYYRFSKTIEDDPELNKKKAVKAIARFASLHPTSLSQKTEVMIEHFRRVTMKRIGGKAKAMVVTASRKHALRYYLSFKEYIHEKGYSDIKPLVAFSGTLYDDAYPEGVTEPQLNKFGEKELPKKFNKDEYQVLLVADKYQTGFDQPRLQTMYVDKKLSGVKAVQTLSRLNRICHGKEDTFILDFANDRETIIESFQPYYTSTTMTETADPNHLYDLKNEMSQANIYYQSEIDGFSKIFYKPGDISARDQGRLYAFMDPSIDRYKAIDEEKQDAFKNSLTAFIRLYSFLSQIVPFQDVELEKLYTFGRFLLTRLPKTDYTERLKLDNEVTLKYYRLQKMEDGDLVLKVQNEFGLNPVTEAGIKRAEDEKEKLSNIITMLNEKYGTEFNNADKLFFDQLEEEMYLDEDLKKRAQNNTIDNFKLVFEEEFMKKLVERMETNDDIADKIIENPEFQHDVKDWMANKIYERFRALNNHFIS